MVVCAHKAQFFGLRAKEQETKQGTEILVSTAILRDKLV